MSINAPVASAIDIRLPLTPESPDPDIFPDLLVIYTAIRSLQSGVGLYLGVGVDVPQYTTALAPTYKKGRIYFDTTLNKLRVGGAAGWETITSV